MKTMYERYRFFHEHAGYIVGESAVCAMRLARAEERAEREGLRVEWEDEAEPWIADCPAPPIHVAAYVPSKTSRVPLASLGSIGLLSWSDPYVRVVEAELFAEALDALDTERGAEATRIASEMSERATFASGSRAVRRYELVSFDTREVIATCEAEHGIDAARRFAGEVQARHARGEIAPGAYMIRLAPEPDRNLN